MPRSPRVSVAILCIILILFPFLYMVHMETSETVHSKNANYIHQWTQKGIESAEPMIPKHEDIGSKQMDERKDVVARKYQRDEFQAGINLLVYEHPNISNAQKLFKHLRNLGINSVAIVYPFVQSDWQADQVQLSPTITPMMEEIKALIVSAHTEDLNVMLRPILDEKSIMVSGHWRGTIKPKNPKTWFDSYRTLLLTYAELAQAMNVEIFNIGTEFNSLQNNKYGHEWLRLIKEMRGVYQGKLTYSFNWNCFRDIPSIEFVSMLDYVGVDAYFPLDAPDDVSVEDLEKAWEKWTREIKEVLKDESILLTEVGMIPIAGAHRQPYAWSIPGGKVDWQAQANYYEATYNTWQLDVEGMYWWAVTVNKPDPRIIDYSPLGAPAEEILKQMFLKKETDDMEN